MISDYRENQLAWWVVLLIQLLKIMGSIIANFSSVTGMFVFKQITLSGAVW